MKKLIRTLAVALVIVTMIGLIPVQAGQFGYDWSEYYGLNTYFPYLQYDIEGLTEAIENATTEKQIKHLQAGLDYVEDVYYYYKVKLEKVAVKQFKTIKKYTNVDEEVLSNMSYTITKEDKEFKRTVSLSKKNKYYDLFKGTKANAKKWYKNAKKQIKKLTCKEDKKDIHKFDAVFTYLTEKWNKCENWSINFACTYRKALEKRLTAINAKKSYIENTQNPSYEEYVGHNFNNIKISKKSFTKADKTFMKLLVQKNPDKTSNCQYSFKEPYIDKYGVKHKYFTALYDVNGYEHIIQIGGLIEIKSADFVTSDNAYESQYYTHIPDSNGVLHSWLDVFVNNVYKNIIK